MTQTREDKERLLQLLREKQTRSATPQPQAASSPSPAQATSSSAPQLETPSSPNLPSVGSIDVISGQVPLAKPVLNAVDARTGIFSKLDEFTEDWAKQYVKDSKERPFETAVTTAVGMTPLGRAGLAGRLALNTAASGAAKRADIAIGAREDDGSFESSFLKAGFEQIFGETIAKGFSKLIPAGVKSSIGLTVTDHDAAETLMRNRDGRTVAEAQEAILGNRYLTIAQETAGATARKKTKKLQSLASLATEDIQGGSEFVRSMRKMDEELSDKLFSYTPNSKEALEAVNTTLNSTIESAFKAINTDIKSVATERVKYGAAKFNASGLHKAILATTADVTDSLGDEAADELFAKVTNSLSKRVGRDGSMTFADAKSLMKDIDNALSTGTFKDAKAVQTSSAGIVGGFNTLIEGFQKASVKEGTASEGALAWLTLASKEKDLLQKRSLVENTKLIRSLGQTELAQAGKGLDDTKAMAKVFESETTWKQAEDFLTEFNPKLLKTLETQFTIDLMGQVTDASGRVASRNMSQYLAKNADLIKSVKGEDFLNTLEDVNLIATARDSVQELATEAFQTQAGDSVQDILRKYTARTFGGYKLGQAAASASLLDRMIASSFGVDKVSDQKLYETLRGEAGQALFDKMSRVSLSDPKAYNLYVQIMNEMGVKPITRTTFNAVANTNLGDAVFNEVSGRLDSLGKADTPTSENDGGGESMLKKSLPNIEKDVKNFESRVSDDPIANIIREDASSRKALSPVEAIVVAAQEVGIDQDILTKIAKAESSLNPSAKAKTSSAGGLFQFIDSTWKDMVKRHGAKHGITVADKFDPRANSIMGAIFTKENAERLKPVLGREPNAREIYLAHFSGAGTAKRVLSKMKSNPNAPASEAWGNAAIKANKSIFYNNGKLRTVEEVFNRLTNKVA